MLRLLAAALALAALAAPVRAQAHDHQGHGHHGHDQAGDLAPPGVPSGLSVAEHDGLLRGAGLGMAAPADRHGYPGPLHVLELADSLALSPRQRAEAERLRAEVLAAAVPLGEAVVVAEQRLDALFASGTVTAGWLERQTAEVARLRGELRAVHLAAHLRMREALTPEQVAAYGRLRHP